MNWEVLTQVLDILAFLLVTPEIIGESRLEAFRKYLAGPADVLKAFLTLVFFLASISIAFAGVLLSSDIDLSRNFFKSPPWIAVIAIIIFSLIFLSVLVPLFVDIYTESHLIPWLIRMTENLAFRGRLFLVGVLFFFIARGVSIWLAVGAHGG